MVTTPGIMHDKETFSEYLVFVGFDEGAAQKTVNRLIACKGTRTDYSYFWDYIDGNSHIYKRMNEE